MNQPSLAVDSATLPMSFASSSIRRHPGSLSLYLAINELASVRRSIWGLEGPFAVDNVALYENVRKSNSSKQLPQIDIPSSLSSNDPRTTNTPCLFQVIEDSINSINAHIGIWALWHPDHRMYRHVYKSSCLTFHVPSYVVPPSRVTTSLLMRPLPTESPGISSRLAGGEPIFMIPPSRPPGGGTHSLPTISGPSAVEFDKGVVVVALTSSSRGGPLLCPSFPPLTLGCGEGAVRTTTFGTASFPVPPVETPGETLVVGASSFRDPTGPSLLFVRVPAMGDLGAVEDCVHPNPTGPSSLFVRVPAMGDLGAVEDCVHPILVQQRKEKRLDDAQIRS